MLREKAGCRHDHFIFDNGSTDGTVEWLRAHSAQFKGIIHSPENIGISRGKNKIIDLIRRTGTYDFLVSFDNDCECVSGNVLERSVQAAMEIKASYPHRNWMLSPNVKGLVRPPTRVKHLSIGGWNLGVVGIIGGLFRVEPAWIYNKFRFREDLSRASGQDENVCGWFRHHANGTLVYLEDFVVNHYETTTGQHRRYPKYFERKWVEEKDGFRI